MGLFLPILMMINAFAMLVGSGGAPRAAIAMDKQDRERAQKILGNCCSVLLVLAVMLTVVFYGFAKFSMMTTVTGAVCNIILDPVFIFGFRMGVKALL